MTRVQNAAEGTAEEGQREALVRLNRELEQLKRATALLGLGACARCGEYFQISNRSAHFEAGESVCRECVEAWWEQQRHHLCVRERELLERRLVNWLVTHHGAKVSALPPSPANQLPGSICLVAGCVGCGGSGQSGGVRCAGCSGRGTVWVVAAPAADRRRQASDSGKREVGKEEL